jgi:hypothetical protein
MRTAVAVARIAGGAAIIVQAERGKQDISGIGLPTDDRKSADDHVDCERIGERNGNPLPSARTPPNTGHGVVLLRRRTLGQIPLIWKRYGALHLPPAIVTEAVLGRGKTGIVDLKVCSFALMFVPAASPLPHVAAPIRATSRVFSSPTSEESCGRSTSVIGCWGCIRPPHSWDSDFEVRIICTVIPGTTIGQNPRYCAGAIPWAQVCRGRRSSSYVAAFFGFAQKSGFSA